MPARRRAMLLFGCVFVILFAVVAISQGIGNPSIPSGDVALIEDAPDGLSEVSQADFEYTLAQVSVQQGLKKTPEPGDPRYEGAEKAAMLSLLESIWLQGLAAEMGIRVSGKVIQTELKKLKNETFQTPKEFQSFLEESGYTQADVDERVKLQILGTRIQEQVADEVPALSEEEIEDYYHAAESQLASLETRDLRLIVNSDRGKAVKALNALRGDNMAGNWRKIAKSYSEGSGVNSGGLTKQMSKGSFEEPLDKKVFSAPEGTLEGPIKTRQGYNVFEVTKIEPEEAQELKEVEGQIESTLAQEAQQEHFAEFVADFNADWRARTFCTSAYTMESCANFRDDLRPATAPASCYEADPDEGRPDACPAPVFQLVPALPGSVTPIEPKGKPLAQRPRPIEAPSE